MQLTFWILLFAATLWLILFLIHAINLRSSAISSYELKRRQDAGDTEAVEILKREALLPRLETCRRIAASVLHVLAITLTIVSTGWVIGVILAIFLSLTIGAAARSRLLQTLASKLYVPREARLLVAVERWHWLDALRGVTTMHHEPVASSKPELRHIIERSAGVLTRDEHMRFQASLAFDAHTVEAVMTPVSVLNTIDVADTLGPLVMDDLHKTGHSRFPVIDKDIHHVVGILYLHDIINLRSAKATVREAMDPRVHYIHESQSLEHALHGFLRTHRHLFIVVNDYRETVGVLTLEDVLETLLGKKIVDEFDQYEDLRAVAESNPRKNNLPKGKTDI